LKVTCHFALDEIWPLTPRQAAAFLYFQLEDDRRRYARDLTIASNGARGDPKKVEKQIRNLSEDD